MSLREFVGYASKFDGACVTISPLPNHRRTGGGIGISSVVIETSESTPEAAFYGAAGGCARFVVTVSRQT